MSVTQITAPPQEVIPGTLPCLCLEQGVTREGIDVLCAISMIELDGHRCTAKILHINFTVRCILRHILMHDVCCIRVFPTCKALFTDLELCALTCTHLARHHDFLSGVRICLVVSEHTGRSC